MRCQGLRAIGALLLASSLAPQPAAGAGSTSANHQIFAWICHLTIGIGSSLEPGACAWNIFDTPTSPLSPAPEEAISAMTAGDRDSRLRSLVDAIIANTKEDLVNRVIALPFSPVNGDPGPGSAACSADPGDPSLGCTGWDGRISIVDPRLNRMNASVPAHTITFRGAEIATPCRVPVAAGLRIESNTGPAFVEELRAGLPHLYRRPTEPGICAQFLEHHDPGDVLSLDSTLSSLQTALLGCGPLRNRRCDSASPIEILPDGLVVDGESDEEAIRALEAAIETLHRPRGGIDLTAVASGALLESLPRGAEAAGEVRALFGPGEQPGTAQVEDDALPDGERPARAFGPACARPDGRGGMVTLPGCRGIETIFLERDAATRQVTAIEISFEDGYRPSRDGCVIGGGDQRISPAAVGNIGGVDVTLRANESGYAPDAAELEECHTTSFSKNGNFLTQSTHRVGSSFLWHPAAGCLGETRAEDLRRFGLDNIDSETGAVFSDCGRIETASGAGVNRTMRDRFGDLDANGFPDIEDEFVNALTRLDGVEVSMAQVFRSEMAALSYNLMAYLVITSCSQESESAEEIRQRADCFDPGNPLRADKCSFNAPQRCAKVEPFGLLAEGVGTLEVERARLRDRKGRTRARLEGRLEGGGAALAGSGEVIVALGEVSEVLAMPDFAPHRGGLQWKGRQGGLRRVRLSPDGSFSIWLNAPTSQVEGPSLPFLLRVGGAAGGTLLELE